ncbi:MAG TPA: serine/threonine-protein kinase [Gemmatimonadota bacterium]|nr:serine/threonine-protein kinase [Gemmatimonadota bacterium]
MTRLTDAAVRRLAAVANLPDLSGTRYTLLEEIGRGGMAAVYRARDETLGRDVAIKVSSAPGGRAELDARMRTEAIVLASLEHPGVVPVHDAGVLPDGRAYYVMKLVRGTPLGELGPADSEVDDRVRIVERVCETMAFAHARGIVHRDLKPDNVMVGGFGEVLVMDWGVAQVPHAEAEPGIVVGTPGYMAPEQAAGRSSEVDERADVYALGAMLCALLTGADPPAVPALARDALAARRDLPRRLRAVCARALATDPAERYADAREMAADLARFRAGRPVAAHPETWLERAGRSAWAYRTAIALVLAYLAMRVAVAWLA